MEEALKRETREETGIEIDEVHFVHFEEVFYYYDPSDRAYHGLHFFFACRPTTLDLVHDDRVEDGSAGRPRWIEIDKLLPRDFQIHGDKLIQLCKHIAA